jgi:hypothetical protein
MKWLRTSKHAAKHADYQRMTRPNQTKQRTLQAIGVNSHMKLTNESYVILMGTKNFTERYYRDKAGWLKVSARGRKFRMTAEQVLNHLLPALAGVKSNLTIKVEHHEQPRAKPVTSGPPRRIRPLANL